MKNLLLLFCVGLITHTVIFPSAKTNKQSLQLLQTAIGYRDKETIRKLITAKASADMTSRVARHTALHLATNSTPILKLLFEVDPQGSISALRMKNKNGRTPLEKAEQGYKTNFRAEQFLKQKLREHPVKTKAVKVKKVAAAKARATAIPSTVITTSGAAGAPPEEVTTVQAVDTRMPPLTLLAFAAKIANNKAKKLRRNKLLRLPRTTKGLSELLYKISRGSEK